MNQIEFKTYMAEETVKWSKYFTGSEKVHVSFSTRLKRRLGYCYHRKREITYNFTWAWANK